MAKRRIAAVPYLLYQLPYQASSPIFAPVLDECGVIITSDVFPHSCPQSRLLLLAGGGLRTSEDDDDDDDDDDAVYRAPKTKTSKVLYITIDS